MRAHLLNAESIIINTIVVDSLDFMAGLIDASHGGEIGDYWSGAEFIPLTDPRHPHYVAPE